MLSLRTKAAFYLLADPFMKANGLLYRWLRAPRNGKVKVHFGPGQKNYIVGWLNLDANMFTGKCDVWINLRNPLPFNDSTVDAAYSHHVIEHLRNLQSHFHDVYRCLKPGGVYRVGGPNGDAAIEKYIQNDKDWFGDFPVSHMSIGGRLENFIFCSQEHVTILTYSYLEELMSEAGFINIKSCIPSKQTNYLDLFKECLAKEDESDFEHPHTLIVEGEKPNPDVPNR